jgi:hypothetical protein
MLGDGEADSSWSGRLLPAFGEQLLVGRRREFLAGRVPPAGVVVLDPGRDRGPGLRPGGEVLQRPQLELQGGVPRFDDRVIESLTADGPWTGRWKAASRPAGRSRRCTRLPRSVSRTTPGTAPPRAATAIASSRHNSFQARIPSRSLRCGRTRSARSLHGPVLATGPGVSAVARTTAARWRPRSGSCRRSGRRRG